MRGEHLNPPVTEPAALAGPTRPWLLMYCLLLACAVALPWIPSYLPVQDGPQHLRLNSFLLEMRANPASPLHSVYVDALRLRTASLFSWFCLLFSPLLSIEAIERLFVSLSIAGFGWVGYLWTRAARPEAPARVLVLAPFFINWFTTMGFFSYLASIPLAAAGCYLLFTPSPGRSSPQPGTQRVLLATLLLLISCLGHISTVLVSLVLSMLLAWARKSRRLLFAVLLAFTPALIVGIFSAGYFDAPVTTQQSPELNIPVFLGLAPALLQAAASVVARAGPIDMALQGLMLLLITILLARAIRQLCQLRRVTEGPEYTSCLSVRLPPSIWPLCGIGVLLLGLLVLPDQFYGWAHAASRLIPFILLLLPAAVAWPRAGSAAERQLVTMFVSASILITIAIGFSWRAVGHDLDNVAGAAQVMHAGTRVLPLTFRPGAESSWAVRGGGRQLHAWAIPARLKRLMVPFGFENMRRTMIYGRADAQPPLPAGPDEFIGPILWASSQPQTPRVFTEGLLDLEEITDAARFLVPGLRDGRFLEQLRVAVLDQAYRGFHYLLLIHPPESLLKTIRLRAWPCLYAQQGTYVYRLGLPLDQFSIQGLEQWNRGQTPGSETP